MRIYKDAGAKLRHAPIVREQRRRCDLVARVRRRHCFGEGAPPYNCFGEGAMCGKEWRYSSIRSVKYSTALKKGGGAGARACGNHCGKERRYSIRSVHSKRWESQRTKKSKARLWTPIASNVDAGIRRNELSHWLPGRHACAMWA